MNVGIIGAGIIGVQIARSLLRQGARVRLYDAREPGSGTSFGNAGYIATDEIFPLAHGEVLQRLPRMLRDPLGPLTVRWRELPRLSGWLLQYARACSRSRSTRSIEALALIQRHAVRAWQDVVERESLLHLVRAHGAIKIFETARGFAENRFERELQRRHGIEFMELDRDAAARRVPELAHVVRHAVLFPRGMHTSSPFELTQALFRRFIADGGDFVQRPIARLSRSAAGRVRIEGEAEAAAHDALVVSAGHLSGRLLKSLEYKVPLVAERGYHVELRHAPLGFDLPVGLYERGFYLTPMTSGLRLAGTTEFSSADHDEPPDWARADMLKRHLHALMPGVGGEETGRWMGHRPTLPDFLPVLGRAPGSLNLYLAFGHQHLGLTLSAVTAEIICALVSGGRPPVDITPFTLARFQ